MRWKSILIIALVIFASVAGTAYLFRKQLILYYVATMARDAKIVAPNREIAWQQGPAEAATPATERPPNIVVILADDLGINDISYFGGGVADGLVPTPHIDSIAKQGAAFTKAYSGTAACAPSRAALMTGRYGTRTGFEFTPTPAGMSRILPLFFNDGTRPREMLIYEAAQGAQLPYAQQGLPATELTIAEALKGQDYHTMHIGKWHLGNTKEFLPNAQGFDESVMMESGLYLPEDDPNTVNAKLPFDPIDQVLWARMQYATSYNASDWFAPKGYLTDFYTDEAVKAIKANRNRPFLLYLAHWGVHTPLQASKADYDALSEIKDHRMRVYAAMLRALDRSVGRVLAELKANGLEENTIVIFSSDNGGPGYIGLKDINKPYRGWKLTFFEGGIRVPMFIKWPAKIAPGTESPAMASHLDLLPTALAAAGAPLPVDRTIDGVNLLPLLEKDATIPPRTIFWRDGHYQAVQSAGFKLQIADRPNKVWLFNLNDDPTEQKNLASEMPERVAELKAMIDAHNKTQREPLFPAVGEMPIMIDKTLEEPATKDDEYIYWPG
ncbi:MAG: sulfatase-like hydrolase/transferase [Burkholderiales bacterium]